MDYITIISKRYKNKEIIMNQTVEVLLNILASHSSTDGANTERCSSFQGNLVNNRSIMVLPKTSDLYAHLTGISLAGCSSAEPASVSSGKTNLKQLMEIISINMKVID